MHFIYSFVRVSCTICANVVSNSEKREKALHEVNSKTTMYIFFPNSLHLFWQPHSKTIAYSFFSVTLLNLQLPSNIFAPSASNAWRPENCVNSEPVLVPSTCKLLQPSLLCSPFPLWSVTHCFELDMFPCFASNAHFTYKQCSIKNTLPVTYISISLMYTTSSSA